MTENEQHALIVVGAGFLLVATALLAGLIPEVHALYSQILGGILSLVGLHSGHSVLSQKLDAGQPPQVAGTDTVPGKVAGRTPEPLLDPVPAPLVVPVADPVKVLMAVMPHAGLALCQKHGPAYEACCIKYDINTPLERAAFLGNLALECNELREMEEEWTDSEAQQHYENNKLLGNNQVGDGKLYRGRGCLQLTGRYNYSVCGYESNPEAVAEPDGAWDTAGRFWRMHNLNELADEGDFQGVVKKINGGLNDYGLRLNYYERAKKALNA